MIIEVSYRKSFNSGEVALSIVNEATDQNQPKMCFNIIVCFIFFSAGKKVSLSILTVIMT